MGHLLSLGIYANVVLVPCCTPHSWRPTYPVLLNSFLDDLWRGSRTIGGEFLVACRIWLRWCQSGLIGRILECWCPCIFPALQCRCRWQWWISCMCSVLGVGITQSGQCGIFQTVIFYRLLDPWCDLVWCTRMRLYSSCDSLHQLLVMMFPIHSCMIFHWLLLRRLLLFPGRCMPGFPCLYESVFSRWPCLEFPWVSP